jgi:hypothetical protein
MNPLVSSILFSDQTTGSDSSADLGNTIAQSLRLRGSQVLRRDFSGAATSNTTGTISMWLKKTALITEMTVFCRDGQHWFAAFGNDDRFSTRQSGGGGFVDFGTDLYRDTSAWYHFVVSINSNTATLFVNGVQHSTTTTVDDLFTSGTDNIRVFSEVANGASSSFNGFAAEFIFVDGQALVAEDVFGRFNNDGVWVPIEYEGTFGNNGFYLDFADDSNPGNDVSGNNNDFTDGGGNIDTSAISGSNIDNDVDILDTPTSNFATLNRLAAVPTVFDQTNLRQTNSGTSAWEQGSSSMHLTEGKWYWEARADDNASWGIGIADSRWDINGNDNFIGGLDGSVGYNGANGNIHINGSASSYGNTYTDGDVIGVALDLENDAVWFSKNGSWQAGATQDEIQDGDTSNAAATGLSSDRYYPVCVNSGTSATRWKWNFGQMNFQATAPSGFKKIQSNNMPNMTVKNGRDHFEPKLYSGTGVANTITGLNFAPGLIWIKGRTTTDNHVLVDTIRGTDSVIFPNTNDNQDSSFGRFTSFNSDGFEVDTTDSSWNESGKNYVAYCWKAGATTSTNNDGTRSATVSVNDTAGFSMVSFDGTSGDTVGHGLSSKPQFIINRDVENDQHWRVFHAYMGVTEAYAVSDNIHLDLDDGFPAARGAATRIDLVTDTTFRIAGGTAGAEQISYCWREVEGYSSFGVYQGLDVDPAGKSPDSREYNFIYTGFKPAWLMIKCVQNTSGSAVDGDSWVIWNNASSPKNFAFETIMADTQAQEINSGDQFAIDLVSNGFKIRSSNNAINNASREYIWMAFAEHPFGGQNTPPATAR